MALKPPSAALSSDQARPVARPQTGSMSVYHDAYAVEVVDFMGQGFSLTAFAGHIGQPFEIVCDWMRDCEAFNFAVARGRAKRVMALEQTFLKTESGPKVSSHKHALNNAAPQEWRDKIEHVGPNDGPITVIVKRVGADGSHD